MPTAVDDPNVAVDTVPVTVTNNDPGDERLNQLVIEITPGWTAGPPGPNQCNASDFSIDGQPPGTPVTLPSGAVPDAALPTTLSAAPGAGEHLPDVVSRSRWSTTAKTKTPATARPSA